MQFLIRVLLWLVVAFPIFQFGQVSGYVVMADGRKVGFDEREENGPLSPDIWSGNLEKRNVTRVRLRFEDSVKLAEIIISLPAEFPANPTSMMANGFQSWSISREYELGEKIKQPSPLLRWVSREYGDWNYLPKHPKPDLYSWSWSWVRGSGDTLAILSSLSEQDAYSCLIPDIQNNRWEIHRDFSGRVVQGEIEVGAFMTEQSTFAASFDTARKAGPAQVWGWTSWYNYYTKIDERIILENLRKYVVAELPITIFQIDDGFQEQTGDWLEVNEKFPRGMKYLADSIHQCGMKAGIWLAPFVVGHTSRVAKEHPEWLLRDEKGKKIKAGINPGWDGKYYALNIYHPEAAKYIKHCVKTMTQEWGFDLLKVDFLFAACMRSYPNKTRAEVMTDAVHLLRDGAGENLLLGCGTPLAPGYRVFDYCRIGPDVHLKWEFGSLKNLGARERPDTKGAIQNTINRWILDGDAWGNDPDVFMLREENQKLSWEQRWLLFEVNRLFGTVLFTSDDIGQYDAKTLELYRNAIGQERPAVMDVTPLGESAWRVYVKQGATFGVWDINAGKKNKGFPPLEYYPSTENGEKGILKWDEQIEIPPYSIRKYVTDNTFTTQNR